jgi:hypothetical protein
MSSDRVWGPSSVESALSAWDERVRFLASQLRALARSCPVLAVEARQLAHSIEELVGLEGLVSEDYVGALFSRARGLASVVQQLPQTLSSRAPAARATATVSLLEDRDEEQEQTKPGTPTALNRARRLHTPEPCAVTAPPPQGFTGANSDPLDGSEESPGSGLRPVLRGRKDTTLRLRTG